MKSQLFGQKIIFFVDKRKNRTILLKMFRSEMQIWQAVFRFPTPARRRPQMLGIQNHLNY